MCRADMPVQSLRMIRMKPEAVEGAAAAASSGVGSSSALKAMSDPEITRKFNEAKSALSSKLQSVMAKLAAVQQAEPAAKFLVFSAFEQTRARLETELKKGRYSYVGANSNMSPGQQAQQIHKFNVDPECTVLVLSLQAASVGLNLTAANHIFFVDQPLSLTQTKQAVGRCHRIGQGRPVSVCSFVTRDTIEAAVSEAAKQQEQEASADPTGPQDGSKKARGRNLLGRDELMAYFGLTPDDIFASG